VHHVSLSWNASTTPGSQYYIYRRTLFVPTFTKLNSAPLTGATYTDTTVTAGHIYIYEVTAEVNGIESKPSNQVFSFIE
jgi:fibronectin type 3 domain-containing protein